MQFLRDKFLALVLTLIVGLGLATSALAHRIPTLGDLLAEQSLQALHSSGLPSQALCGQTPGKSPCPDSSCAICPGGAAVQGAAFAVPVPVLVWLDLGLALPSGTVPVTERLHLGHDARGPPVPVI